MDKEVHQLVLFATALLGVSCFAAFFYLIDYASRLLRPISILTRVGNRGLAVIRSVYPDMSFDSHEPQGQHPALGLPDRVIQHKGRSELFWPLISRRLWTKPRGSTAASSSCLRWVILLRSTNLSSICTAEPQSLMTARYARRYYADPSARWSKTPTFAFRIVIDIALKALSPAINDPTTAVLAIDQLNRMLRMVGKRHLGTDEIFGPSGQLRVFFRTPNWEDFVHLAFSEIRACGSNNLQIVRRLRAMIENLIQTLPAHRHPALQQELRVLDREIEKQFSYPEELSLARIADSQGLGGHSGKSKPKFEG